MNVSNLEVDQVVKNYKGLCDLLGIKVKTGNAKKAQMKDVERYISYKKQGYKFVITEIYRTPKHVVVNKRNNIYGEMLELAIMNYLIQSKRRTTTATKNYLLGEVEMINSNYKKYSRNQFAYARDNKIDIRIVNDFFNVTNGNFKKILERSLDSLVDKSIISYKIVRIIKNNEEQRKATPIEDEMIMKYEREVLDQLGYEKKSQVRMSKDWKNFKDKVEDLLIKNEGIHYYFSSYEININNDHIEQQYKKLQEYIISESERIENRDSLTGVLSNSLVDNAKKRQDKTRMDKKFETDRDKARCTFTYVDDIKKIVNDLINPYQII
ncbi:hypothetical protein ACA30_05760 [Virgibacillus soli]|nr:hypothetical protein ACA30_05760 [Virgibacillus soli]